MRIAAVAFILSILFANAMGQPSSPEVPASQKRIVIAASTLLDGRGQVLHDTRIVVEGSKIVALDPKAEPDRLRPARPDGVAGLDRLARAHRVELRQGWEERQLRAERRQRLPTKLPRTRG